MKEEVFSCLLLAAGKGTRLRPITDGCPKCLVRVGGVTMLERWMESLHRSGCKKVIVNTHYLADKVERVLNRIEFEGMEIVSMYEPELLGTAGSLFRYKELYDGEFLMVAHADNLLTESLDGLIDAHKTRDRECCMTMALFRSNQPSACGIVQLSEDKRVVEMHEKVDQPPGDLANAALYVMQRSLLDKVPEGICYDISRDLIPEVLGRIQAFELDSFFIDVGTPNNLEKANEWVKRNG